MAKLSSDKNKQAKQWAVGDRCYVLTINDGVRCGRVEELYARGGAKVRLKDGFVYWANAGAIREHREALDREHLGRQLKQARRVACEATKESLRARRIESRALSKVATLEGKLAVAKAKVTK